MERETRGSLVVCTWIWQICRTVEEDGDDEPHEDRSINRTICHQSQSNERIGQPVGTVDKGSVSEEGGE